MWLRRIAAAASTALGFVGFASLPADVEWWLDMIESAGSENLKWAVAAIPFLVGLWLWRHDIPGLRKMTGAGKWGSQAQSSSAPPPPVTQTVTVINEATKKLPEEPQEKGAIFHVAEGLPSGPDGEERVRVGTTRGPMTIRLNHEKTLDDVLRILGKHNALASLSDEYEMDRGREE